MDPRTWFATAASGLVDVVGGVRQEQLSQVGLGEWDVRSLMGHAARAFITIENYLGGDGPPTLDGPRDYYLATRAGLADPAQVTQRGRDAGVALGADPVAAVGALGDRVTGLVSRTPDDAIVATPVGSMTLMAYLPTRAFELTVHGIDLARSTGGPVPPDLAGAASEAIALCGAVASADQCTDALMALTGRSALPDGFSVL